VESSAEQDARLRREEAEHQHNLAAQVAEDQHRRRVFWVVLGVLINNDASTETQAWARNAASTIVGGIVGYFTGSAGKAPR
jgi:hypothetical protein